MTVRPLFTVVIPTIGRPSIRATLLSIRGQASVAWVEVVVVADTHRNRDAGLGKIADACREHRAQYLELDAGAHDTGSPQLHMGFARARAGWVLNCGDDDMYVPGAFETIAGVIERERTPPGPLMFKVELYPNERRGNREPVVLWQERRIERFNVTGQGFVCPNDPRRMGRWVDDVTFMRETVALHDGRVEWREELIARCY